MTDSNNTTESPQYFLAIYEKVVGGTEIIGVFDTLECAKQACQDGCKETLSWSIPISQKYWIAFGGWYHMEGTDFKIYPVVLNTDQRKAAQDE